MSSEKTKNRYSGFYKIFQFTFNQRVKTRGYRSAVIIGALLCLLAPMAIMACLELFGGDGEEPVNPVTTVMVAETTQESAGAGETADAEMAEADNGGAQESAADGVGGEAGAVLAESAGQTGQAADYSQLNGLGSQGYDQISYEMYGTPQEALDAAAGVENAAVLIVERGSQGDLLSLVLPQDSNLSKSDLEGLERFVGNAYPYIQMQRTGLEPQELAKLTAPVSVDTHRSAESQESALDALKEALAYILPYLNIMVLYFMVLFYGQGVATSVLMEKTSKLMDTMLLAAKPGGMVIGKVLAQALAGVVQIFIWLAALAGGLWGGALVVRFINPDSQMAILQLMDMLGGMGGLFAVSAAVAALLQIVAGFLLYCSLAAIGGAVAGKQEDLSSTSLLFILALIGSFCVCLYSGGLGTMSPASAWLNWVPFTAVMIVPGRVLLGQIPLWQAYGSIVVVLAAFVLISLLAGKIYKSMALYKGQVPGIGKILKMMK